MSSIESSEYANVVQIVGKWPPELKLALASELLQEGSTHRLSGTRGRPVQELIGLGAGKTPPPDDTDVARWIDEYRMGKYG